MSDIPEDIMNAASKCYWEPDFDTNPDVVAKVILAERDRCLSILKSIETMNPSEPHLIETIVRRIRGSV